MASIKTTEESSALQLQNQLIAESCKYIMDSATANAFRNYQDAGQKLAAYHVRYRCAKNRNFLSQALLLAAALT
jgi:hypothetical protein